MNDFLNKIKEKFKNQPVELQKEINGSRNLIIFLVGSLGIALILVIASLVLYTADGTIQLDLSRPVLQEAREAQKKVKKEEEKRKQFEKDEDFSPQGGLSNKEMGNFELFYSRARNKIHANEFNENSLSDEALKITDQ